MEYGGKNEIPQVEVKVQADVFENAIREIGVEFACEWFGHNADSDFTKESIKTLCERSGIELDEDDEEQEDWGDNSESETGYSGECS